MPVYMVIEIEVKDPETYAEYMRRVPAVVAKYDGRYLVRGGPVIPLSGNWRPQRVIILEFSRWEEMKRFGTSPEYQSTPARVDPDALDRTRGVHRGVGGRRRWRLIGPPSPFSSLPAPSTRLGTRRPRAARNPCWQSGSSPSAGASSLAPRLRSSHFLAAVREWLPRVLVHVAPTTLSW